MNRQGTVLGLMLLWFLSACTSVPDGLQPVQGFQLERYLGQWYEIARLDHRFERGLTQVTATYSLLDNGRVSVLNRGYDPVKAVWREAHGVARFQGARNVGSLEVSFFGPFYGGYHIIVLDPEYRYAMVAGPDRDYLWILARQPRLPPTQLERLIAQAKAWGFATEQLIYVDHAQQDKRK